MRVSAGHLNVSVHTRSQGHSVAAGLAYRFGLRLVDSYALRVHNYARRSHAAEIAATGFVHGATVPAWDAEPQAFADALEAAERRANSVVARDITIALPAALDHDERIALSERFAGQIAERYDVPIAWAVHPPSRDGDQANWHAHLLMSTRALDPETGQPGAKIRRFHIRSTPEKRAADSAREQQRTDKGGAAEIGLIRCLWETTCNAALEDAGSDERITMGPVKNPADRKPVLIHGEVAAERILWRERNPGEPLSKSVRQLVIDNHVSGGCRTRRATALAEHELAHPQGFTAHAGYHEARLPEIEPGEIEFAIEQSQQVQPVEAPKRPDRRERKPRERKPRRRRRRARAEPVGADADDPTPDVETPARLTREAPRPTIAQLAAPCPAARPPPGPPAPMPPIASPEVPPRSVGHPPAPCTTERANPEPPTPVTPLAPAPRRERAIRTLAPAPAPGPHPGPVPGLAPIERVTQRRIVTVEIDITRVRGPQPPPPEPVRPIRRRRPASLFWEIVAAPAPAHHAGAATSVVDTFAEFVAAVRAIARALDRLGEIVTRALTRPAPRPRRGVAAPLPMPTIDPDEEDRVRAAAGKLQRARTQVLEHRRRVIAARPQVPPPAALRGVLIDRLMGAKPTEDDGDERVHATESQLRANPGPDSRVMALRDDPIRLWLAARWLTEAIDAAQQRVWGRSGSGGPAPAPYARAPDEAETQRIDTELRSFTHGAGRAIDAWIDRTAPADQRSTTRWHPYTAVVLDRLLGVAPTAGDRDMRVREMRAALMREVGPRLPAVWREDERRLWAAAGTLTDWADRMGTSLWGRTAYGEPAPPPDRLGPGNTDVEQLTRIVGAIRGWEIEALAEVPWNQHAEPKMMGRGPDRARRQKPELGI